MKGKFTGIPVTSNLLASKGLYNWPCLLVTGFTLFQLFKQHTSTYVCTQDCLWKVLAMVHVCVSVFVCVCVWGGGGLTLQRNSRVAQSGKLLFVRQCQRVRSCVCVCIVFVYTCECTWCVCVVFVYACECTWCVRVPCIRSIYTVHHRDTEIAVNYKQSIYRCNPNPVSSYTTLRWGHSCWESYIEDQQLCSINMQITQ